MFPIPVARCRGPVKFQATSSQQNFLRTRVRILSKLSNGDRAISEAPLRPMATLAGMREIRNSPKRAPALPQHRGHPHLHSLPAFAKLARCRQPAFLHELCASVGATGRKRDAAPERGRLATAALSDGPPLPAAPDARAVPKPMRSAQNLRRKLRPAPIRLRPDLPIPE